MRKLMFGMFAVAVAALTLGSAYSQPPEDREGPLRGREGRPERGERGPGRGGPGGPGGFRGGPPIMVALDTDKDGDLSAEEIANAATALKSLDKNNDGKLTRDEMRPPRGPGRPGEGGPSGRPGEAGGPGRGGPRGFDFAARFEQLDKNGDGKLTKDELPERMQRILDRADSNSDGALDKDELKAMAERFKNREGGRPQDGPPRGERPEGRRPKRPSNDE